MAKEIKEDIATIQESGTDLVNIIMTNAIANNASDVHIDPERDGLHVRFRVDGVLYPFKTFSRYSKEEIITRIKVLAQMDITDHRLPLDGHIEFQYQDKFFNFRVSTIPTVHGEAVVLRIFNREDVLSQVDKLGFTPDQLDTVKKLIASPHGMILITGPTGAGKTTLLYTLLGTLNDTSRSIVTLEDPVELQLAHVRQLQINETVNLTFAKAVRSVLRQNPDIIMIGEIRDGDTAQMAFRAALSGVLVFSTFHTFDLPGIVIRLVEMNLPRSVLAYGLTGIVSTRLVRKICNSCRAPYTPSEFEKKVLGDKQSSVKFEKGKGCNLCHGSGYLGRIGIFEIMAFDEEIRAQIIDGATKSTLQQFFDQKTKPTMRDIALQRVQEGVTTAEEVIHAIGFGRTK